MRPSSLTHLSIPRKSRVIINFFLIASFITALIAITSNSAIASTVYGDLNNFDVFNDTGVPCYGFQIELDDIHSTDITYTFDWNHYGPPTITEDNSDPAHPKVFIRHVAKYNSATGTFSAYTAVPSSPPSPTNGHECTNPSVNIGCEHFGVGHYGAPTLIRYNWLIENPLSPGTLILGPAVNVATPSWTYYPPAPAQPVAQVQAVILAPPAPEVPVYEFGDAVWVKCIVTTSHNNQVVELQDLVSDDPDDPNDSNWTNGEPDEVEIEWRILQTEFNNPDGANNDLAGNPEDLVNGDEFITRRYEFYHYAGPLDPETNEAMCDNYPQISDPADPKYKEICAPPVTVLGDYIGSQMAGFNVEAVLGLIDHLQDGELNQPYTNRTVVVGGNTPYDTTVSEGTLPEGLVLDPGSGILSGTPTVAGNFPFRITATDADNAQVTKTYTIIVLDSADACPDDPNKTDPGICGCGVPDIDADNDGYYACTDDCDDTDADINPAATEVCNVKDDDCNGQTDDGIASTPTTCGIGECASAGTLSCVNGQMTDSCTEGLPSAEICDGKDNDCNGQTDDGIASTPTSCGIGECASAGTLSCVNGLMTDSCTEGLPSAEVCDGKDNDCNGQTDDGIASTPTTCGIGECASAGTLSCVNGQMTDNCTEGLPSAEVCDGKDNDCNGQTDDGIASTPTTCGIGECASAGTLSCVNGQMTDSCTEGLPSAEICDGKDNDCNGQTDDGAYFFVGFQQPINQDGSSIFKAGSTIPVKIVLTDCTGQDIATATVTIAVNKISNIILGNAVEMLVDSSGNANSGNLFRYDAIAGQYIFNLSTKDYTKGTYRVYAQINDGISYSVIFSIK